MSTEPAVENARPCPVDVNDSQVIYSTSEVLESDQDRDNGSTPIAFVDKDEPLVTRKELWSYYCEYHSKAHSLELEFSSRSVLQRELCEFSICPLAVQY